MAKLIRYTRYGLLVIATRGTEPCCWYWQGGENPFKKEN
jgi:hypothetical protein